MNLETLTRQVIEAAQQAADFIKKERKNFSTDKIEYKGHSSNLVSYVDKEAENILVNGLRAVLPQAGFITEESTIAQRNNEEYCWLIDPLDGTTNFIHGVPIYSTSIALIRGADEILAGVIINIPTNEVFYAWKNGGAYLNGTPIKVSAIQQLSGSLIATGFPYYTYDKMNQYMAVLNELMRQCHGLRRCGSAAIDLAWVAAGRFEAYFEYNINAWDIAAGSIILQEAGGIATNFKGENTFLFQKNIIATNGFTHPKLVEIFAKYWEV